MIYIVLGMHKSGTTLLSDILHNSGVNMVDDYDGSIDYDNLLGKMERREVLAINHELLNSSKVDSLDLMNVPDESVLSDELKSRIKNIIHSCNNKYENWGIKEPRMCLTYSVWKPFLPEHKLIVIYRNPYHVVRHYAKYYRYPKKILKSFKALKIYKLYNQLIIDILRDSDQRSLKIDYTDLMQSENSLKDIEKFIEHEVSDSRKASKFRMNQDNNLAIKLLDNLVHPTAFEIYVEMQNSQST